MSCLLCQGQIKIYFNYGRYRQMPYGLVRCDACGLVQTNPMPSEEFLREWYQKYDVLGEREPYYQALQSKNPWSTAEGMDIATHFRRVKQICAERSGKLRVLEIGSGHGMFLDLVKRAGWEGVGIELSEPAVRASQANYGIDVKSGTIETVALPDGSFDVVTLWDILEHVPDPVSMLKKSFRLLAPGGYIFIETPNVSSVLDWMVILLARFGVTGPARTFYGVHHLTLWNHKTIRRALSELGFTSTAITPESTPAFRVFRGKTLRDRLMRMGVDSIQYVGRILGRQNKMIVVVKK